MGRMTYTDGRTGLTTTAFRYKLTDAAGTLVKDWTTGATWTEEPAGTYYLDDADAVAGTVYAVEPASGEVGGVGQVDWGKPAATGDAMTLTAAYDAAKTAASQASVNTIDDLIDTEVAAILAAVDTEVAAIKAKTDNLPAQPAAVGSAMTLAANQDVRNVSGTLPAVALAASQPNYAPAKAGDAMTCADATAAKDDLANATDGLGALKTLIDAKASQVSVNAIPTTPLLAANYTAPDNAGIAAAKAAAEAAQAAAEAVPAAPSAGDIKTAVEAEGSHLALIKAKTDSLPAAPAAVGDAMTLTSAYDAAKAAAAPGAKMDLVDAPNATALAAVKTAMEAAGSTLHTLVSRILGTLLAGDHNPPLTGQQTTDAVAAGIPAPVVNPTPVMVDTDEAALAAAVGPLIAAPIVTVNPTVLDPTERALIASATDDELSTTHGSGAWGPDEPTEGVTVTQATIGTDGLAIGSVMPYGKITAWLDGSPEWRFDADADGDFSYTLPAGSIWTLIAKAPAGDYEDAIATVSTIDVS